MIADAAPFGMKKRVSVVPVGHASNPQQILGSIKAGALDYIVLPREAAVLEFLANGCSKKLMARELGISPRTVEIHRLNMLSKIGVANSTAALHLKLEADGAMIS
jgi:DNA-binding CsgD family transcriptional regulator